ncbi:hypothetical protein Pa4123_29460 [Phytohabitans aurantiacus]|uniref:Uncharacterized protein n=1 Tax=Phytohabitans aurantiacus TaxID=3016789 RepID=A0ABQ5QVJ4_9ACTN|nr:hypothetical protein Pa4123_29460 [Phytohabitans aurantiacus]
MPLPDNRQEDRQKYIHYTCKTPRKPTFRLAEVASVRVREGATGNAARADIEGVPCRGAFPPAPLRPLPLAASRPLVTCRPARARGAAA